jgi:hypothetical protein
VSVPYSLRELYGAKGFRVVKALPRQKLIRYFATRIQGELRTISHSLGKPLVHIASVRSRGPMGMARIAGGTVMKIAQAAPKVLALMRRRRAARPKRSLADWMALTIARGLSLAVVGGLVYVTYVVEMTGFDDFRKCSKNSAITRIEWVLGFRPAEDCRPS